MRLLNRVADLMRRLRDDARGNVAMMFGFALPVLILITVGVALETMKQLESQLLMRHYEGFLK